MKVESMNTLKAWLQRKGARYLRNEELPNGDIIEWIAVEGRLLILQTYRKNQGWDIYRPCGESNLVQDTLCELENWLEPKRTV